MSTTRRFGNHVIIGSKGVVNANAVNLVYSGLCYCFRYATQPNAVMWTSCTPGPTQTCKIPLTRCTRKIATWELPRKVGAQQDKVDLEAPRLWGLVNLMRGTYPKLQL